LSANFLAALDQDFQEHGIEAIQKLRQESPAKYSEITSRLILSAEPADQDEMRKAQSYEEIAKILLKSVGLEGEPTKRQIAAAVKANAAFLARIERIAGVASGPVEPTYNGKRVTAHWPEESGDSMK
jgi:hypothetical protein